MAWFYGWTPEVVGSLASSEVEFHWLAMTQIEAEQSILQIKINAFPNMTKANREKLLGELRQHMSYVDNNSKPVTLEELARKMIGGA